MGIFWDANGQRRRNLPTTVLYRGPPDSPGGIVYENSRKNLGQVVGPVGTCCDVLSVQLQNGTIIGGNDTICVNE